MLRAVHRNDGACTRVAGIGGVAGLNVDHDDAGGVAADRESAHIEGLDGAGS